MREIFQPRLQKRWGTFSIYEKFEHLIITLLTAIIAAIVAQRLGSLFFIPSIWCGAIYWTLGLSGLPGSVWMVLTVLIAMEFKHSLLIVLHQQRDIVQIRSSS